MKLTFLSADRPLTKTITQKNGVIHKTDYHIPYNVTSEEVEATTLKDVFQAISTRASSKSKPCLFKGELIKPLVNESRAQMSERDTPTQLIMFDLDKAPFSTPAEFMNALGLPDMSYIWQWSSSSKLSKKDKTLNGHIFMLLDAPVHPRLIKAWLMHLNLNTEVLRKHITLSPAKQALHWPLDVVVNDNSRLIFIAEPEFKGMTSPIPSAERVQYVKGAEEFLSVTKVKSNSMEKLKTEAAALRDELRLKEGLKKITHKIKITKDGHELQTGVGEVTHYEVIDCGDYYRYNLNGGDSQAYWHSKKDFEVLHNFKGEPSMLMKEVMPDRFRELANETYDQMQLPNEDGDVILAFIDKRTATYWKGIWNPDTELLDLDMVNNKDQIHNYYANHNLSPPPFIPEWRMVFDPNSQIVVDSDNQVVNQFVMPKLMRPGMAKAGKYPLIQHAIDSAVGRGEIQEHFLNWLAVVLQHRIKTKTSWILHGTYGTGKGVLINDVLAPVMGTEYCGTIRASALQSSFDGWKENKLLMLIDEIEADIFDKGNMEGDLRNLITEPIVTIHKKGVNMYQAESFINLIFASNKPQPVHIPMGDRRFNVGVYQHVRWLPTREEIEVLIPKEREAFMHYIMTRPACIDTARQVLHTEDKAAIQALGVTSIDEFAHNIVTGDLVKLWEYMPDERAMNEYAVNDVAAQAYASMLKRFVNQDVSNISRDELRLLFQHAIGRVPEGANKFTTFLRHHNINTKRIHTEQGANYGIQIKWNVTEDQRAALRAGNKSTRKATDKVRRIK